MKIVGLLLAGGKSRRMGGGDKALRLLGGITLLERAIGQLRPQVDTLVLNANGDPGRFAKFGLPVVPDSAPDFAGPLAGVLAGLIAPTSSASPPTRRSCPSISSRGSPGGSTRRTPTSPAPRRVAVRIRFSGCGRCGYARISAGR